MFLNKDTFIPSVVLDDLYDVLNEHVIVSANEDIYDKDVVRDVVEFFDAHPKVNQFVYSINAVDYSTDMLIVSWIEKYQLRHERFLYDNGNRMYNSD